MRKHKTRTVLGEVPRQPFVADVWEVVGAHGTVVGHFDTYCDAFEALCANGEGGWIISAQDEPEAAA